MSANGEAWESLAAVRPVILVCFLPIVLYRVWRVVRHPTSVPAVAATAFGVLMWFWILEFTDAVWSALPPIVHAASAGGWAAITIGACLQVFVIGIAGDASPERIRRGLRLTAITATLALVVVAVLASRSRVLMGAGDAYALAEAFLSGDDPWAVAALVVGNIYIMFVAIQLVWIGFRHADRTPLGVGLGLMATGAMFQLVASSFGGVWRPLSRGTGGTDSVLGLWLQTWSGCIAAVLMVAGFLWPPVMLRVQAHRDVRRLRPLHDSFAGLFPGLFPPKASRMRLTDLAFEWITQIQDGLTLLAQARGVPLNTSAQIPVDGVEHIDSVTNWLTGQSVPGFSAEWLRAPAGTSDEEWIFAIADAYRERQEDLEAPASLSGMPSTLRK
ncbi:hypothetical protein AOT83_01675 [Mycobacteroides sp. H001]|nr:hypothetical protein AOT86_22920 [Mycobacteroides sp. H072]KRQ42697.1 hypothetical protein AOT84_00625 [Mycobacteroides sp. H002]KRQ48280.1 hypothetical protein AOT85_19310 [Mycobacteroides sp. H054]KRQ73126.1 hypothetical protein AOT83_01675 [Mycobacteroides sp. H001]OHU39128.1 hypothetical protein BKG79_12290 [Mycobacteroides chelonae]